MGKLTLSLGIYAGVILAFYSFYFIKIIKGRPQEFEMDMLKALANWMISTGAKSQSQIWLMLMASIILEVVYFVLVLTLVNNLFLIYFTYLLAGFETVHIIMLFYAFYRFFHTRLLLKDIFNWRYERISAQFFFTHTLLIIVYLSFL